MSKPVKTGGTVRDNLEDAADKGNRTAIKALRGPPRPTALWHLWKWHILITSGLGEGVHTVRAPLDWVKLDRCMHLMKLNIYPHEITLLFHLDTIARHPGALEKLLS